MIIKELTKTGAVIVANAGDSATFQGDRGYQNSTRGRAQLEAECPTDIVQAVESVWGTTPTVTEPTSTQQPDPVPSAEQQQLAAMALTQAQQENKITELQQVNAALMLKLAGGNA